MGFLFLLYEDRQLNVISSIRNWDRRGLKVGVGWLLRHPTLTVFAQPWPSKFPARSSGTQNGRALQRLR